MDFRWESWLAVIERAEDGLKDDLSNLDLVFRTLPLEIFGELLVKVPDSFPRLQGLLPKMPSDEIQRKWTGSAGLPLLYQSTGFVRAALKYFPSLSVRADNLRALDFGCGWGRLMRLFSKYFPIENLEGVDPWDQSIQICRDCGLRNPLSLSEYLPTSLPTHHQQFEFIYAYSVFTHLSRRAFSTCFSTLRRYTAPGGVMLITIRPAEYWLQVNQPELYSHHLNEGWAYAPHAFKVIDGDSVYGDTSISLELLARYEEWRILDVETSHMDPLQTFVALSPR